ncbi:MAG: glutaminyl-tRNA synthase (glutamine-hydrolyzing) subunit B [Verrucomicrobia bacterium GWC2_42_7]|nr:MAG: glutaminyl-tRNA synthase (glutamine-hydrolyzing) subunit B [Verrucomicrobia bacterium GWC2_42_7]
MEYEAVIGLEVHVQLGTKTKLFTRVPYAYGAEPNTLTNSVVLGLPGALPVMNLQAIRDSIRVGLIFNCQIPEICKWDRKHYFYPDMPKNYQISQYDKPICQGGEVEIELPGSARNIMGKHRMVKLTRIHLEEDVGKLTHIGNESLVDYNRAGTPLIEIVTEPDMHNADEVFAFLKSLRMHLLYAGISDCDMEKGQMRCDANISVRPKGERKLGTKVELKNLNSISGVCNGVSFEIKRQIESLESGQRILQETRRWDAEGGITISMRSKEMAHDYRYFPDPDLMPVKISKEWRESIRAEQPELPFIKQERFFQQYDLPYSVTSVICPDKELSDYFEEAVSLYNQPKMIANFIVNELLRELSVAGTNGSLPLAESKVKPHHLASLAKLVDQSVISSQIAKEVFNEIFKTGQNPEKIVEDKDLKQNTDTSAIEKLCADAINNNPKAVAEFKSGKDNAINAIKGQVMKASQGKANPKIIDEILRKLLA